MSYNQGQTWLYDQYVHVKCVHTECGNDSQCAHLYTSSSKLHMNLSSHSWGLQGGRGDRKYYKLALNEFALSTGSITNLLSMSLH